MAAFEAPLTGGIWAPADRQDPSPPAAMLRSGQQATQDWPPLGALRPSAPIQVLAEKSPQRNPANGLMSQVSALRGKPASKTNSMSMGA